MFAQFKTLPELFDFFRDENTCIAYWEQIRWRGIVTCPHCKSENPYKTNRGYKCTNRECQKKFNALTKSIFENTKLPLRIWFGATYLLTTHKKGISSLQLSKFLGIHQKSAWFLMHRIRELYKDRAPMVLSGIVEADESFVGGKNKNRHWDKKVKGSQGRSRKDKTPVIGLVQRDGNVITYVTKDTSAEVIHEIINNNVTEGSTIVSDSYTSYNGLEDKYNRVVIKHTPGTGFYVRKENDTTYHTQNIEGYWSLIKRGYIGVYHYMSPKHLQRYCDEFAYRYNTRKVPDNERFEDVIRKSENNRLKYFTLVGRDC